MQRHQKNFIMYYISCLCCIAPISSATLADNGALTMAGDVTNKEVKGGIVSRKVEERHLLALLPRPGTQCLCSSRQAQPLAQY